MPLYDLLEGRAPGARPVTFLLGAVGTVGAYGLALLAHPEGLATAPWMLLVTAGLVACLTSGLAEKGATSGTTPTILSTLAVTLGACLAMTCLVMMLPASWAPTEIGAAAGKMPIDLRPEPHDDLGKAPEVYAPYLLAGAWVALAGAFFGTGGASFLVLAQALAWAVVIGEAGRAAGGVPAGLAPTGKLIGVTATYLLPALLGLTCVGCAARTGMRRFLGGRSGDADNSLRGPGLALIVGLLCLLLAGSVELFGGGSLARMLGG